MTLNVAYSELGRWGRLGNQLWEIASTIGIAYAHGGTPHFNRWDYEPYYNVPSGYFGDIPPGSVNAADYATNMPESERMYLQDHHLWWPIRDAIRDFFTPSERSEEQLAEYDWFFKIPNKVALHIRRDERVHSFKDTHPSPPLAYYENAMEVERFRFDKPTFCVFSDDIAWCRPRFPSEFIFVDGYPRFQDTYMTDDEPEPRDHLDLFLMSACDGHIITNSTYSWWGAALSDNPNPIYPTRWYGPALAHVDWRLQIPPDWSEVGW